MTGRSPAWYVLNDRDGALQALERELDEIEHEFAIELSLQWERTAARLRALGFPESKLRPMPRYDPRERYSANHPTAANADRVEREIVTLKRQAERRRGGPSYREGLAAGLPDRHDLVIEGRDGSQVIYHGAKGPRR